MVNPANRLEVCPAMENGRVHPCLVTRVPALTTHGEADARLISAAPELLSECENAALALEEAAKLLLAKGLGGCAKIMAGHALRARLIASKARGQ